jgi:membrane associated rhomboid family serine protease
VRGQNLSEDIMIVATIGGACVVISALTGVILGVTVTPVAGVIVGASGAIVGIVVAVIGFVRIWKENDKPLSGERRR